MNGPARHGPLHLCPDCDTRREILAAVIKRVVQEAAADGSTVTWDGAWHITPPADEE